MPKTAVGLFEVPGVADQVVRDLVAAGVSEKEVRVLKEPLGMNVSEVTSIPHTDFEVSLGREIKAIGASDGEANAYVEGVRRGGALVLATGSDEQVDAAARIMNGLGAIQVEELIGREPSAKTASAHMSLSLHTNAPSVSDASTQTGRVRQSGDGVRVFVW